jgi:NAD kinase
VRDSSAIELKLTGNFESVFLTLDGQKGIPMQSDDRIRITRSPQCLKLIQPPKKSYSEILRNKLKMGRSLVLGFPAALSSLDFSGPGT